MIDLHKFYFEHLIKATVYLLGIIGAIVTYVITNKLNDPELIRIGLMLPAFVAFGTTCIFGIGSLKMHQFAMTVKSFQVKLQLSWRPHTEILFLMCIFFGALFGIITIGIMLLVFFPELLIGCTPTTGLMVSK